MISHDKASYCKTIGKNLKALRLGHGLTQKNIADMLGVSFQQVQKYETGKNKLPIENLLYLKNYYSTDFETFFEGLNFQSRNNTRDIIGQEDRIISRLKAMPHKQTKIKILKVIQLLVS